MNAAAKSTMEGIPEVCIGYGVSDEFRYLYPAPFLGGIWGGGGRERNAPQGRVSFFPVQADKSAYCVVLCLDDRVNFLSVERGDLIFFFLLPPPPPSIFLFAISCPKMDKAGLIFIWGCTNFLFLLPPLTPRAGGLTYSKILTTLVSTFTSYYIHLWPSFFPDTPLSSPLPSFDGRVVQYPTVENLRDYFCWRQVDCKFFF